MGGDVSLMRCVDAEFAVLLSCSLPAEAMPNGTFACPGDGIVARLLQKTFPYSPSTYQPYADLLLVQRW